MRFYLKLNQKEYMKTQHFNEINWLPIHKIFKKKLSTSVVKFFFEM